jgi:ABC-2 type transport system ATP-binding protein
MTDLAIEATGLTKLFGDFKAVDNLDLQVRKGTVVALLGPNGAGKTTIVRMLATLLRPDSGNAKVNGYDVASEAGSVRRTTSLTGQFAALDPNLTCRENLTLIARLRGIDRATASARADELLERFDAAEFKGRLIKKVSGGQRRRVDLAASLIEQPQLLVLDEPTTGLDPRSRQVVWTTIRELVADGITLLLTTQYLEEADALADRIVLIDHGREIAAGTPAELKAQVGEQRIDVIAADTPAFEQLSRALRDQDFEPTLVPELRRISVAAPNEVMDLTRVSQAVAATGIAIDEIALRRPTLDDAFIALTGHAAEPTDNQAGDQAKELVA